ncbi:MAG: hypothetical protein EOP54_09900 [Sphingobacteriales bacterium]|nr:MAG: hypothetical protein EOP54_09900 [Sphingobacteriales bacterium]
MNKMVIENLFQRSVKSFYKCIESEENSFLKNELDVPLNSILPTYESINITLPFKNCFEQFRVEVKLKLLNSDGNLIGTYSYFENEEEIAIDDFLVVY